MFTVPSNRCLTSIQDLSSSEIKLGGLLLRYTLPEQGIHICACVYAGGKQACLFFTAWLILVLNKGVVTYRFVDSVTKDQIKG